MPYSLYTCTKQIEIYHEKGYKLLSIQRWEEEGFQCTRQGVAAFLKTYEETRSLERRPGSGCPSKAMAQVKEIVEREMRRDDETTATELHETLAVEGYALSKQTVLRCRQSLGWTHQGSAYYQLIRDVNKRK